MVADRLPPPQNKEDNSTQPPIDDLKEEMSVEDPDVLYAQDEVTDVSQFQSVGGEDEVTQQSIEPTVVDGEGVALTPTAAKIARARALREAKKIREDRSRIGSGRKQRAAKKGILKQTEQTYLIQNAASIIQRKAPGAKSGGYPVAEDMENLIIVNSSGNLMNTLTVSQNLLPLMGITTRELSSLTPYIRFWKRTYISENDSNPSLEELKFSSASPSMQEYFDSGIGQEKNVGLKSFSFQSNGDNFWNAKRSFVADMTITFSSLVDLQPLPGKTSWMDLVLPTLDKQTLSKISCEEVSDNEEKPASQKRVEIYVELGYKFSDNSFDNGELKRAIEESRAFMSLYPNQTEFDFKDDGSIDLKISFTTSAELFADLPASNVLAIGTGVLAEQITTLKEDIKKLKSNISEESSSNAKKTLQAKLKTKEQELEEKIKDQRATNYSKFLKHLVTNERLFTFTISENDYYTGRLPDKFVETTGQLSKEEAQKAATELAGKGKKKAKKSGNLENVPTPAGKRTISYFFLGDLINYMAKAIGKDQLGLTKDLAEVVVGDYEFYQFPPSVIESRKKGKIKLKKLSFDELISGTKRVKINMSQLPISLDMYNLFMYENVMKRGATSFTFESFIKRVVTELVDNALDDYLKGRVDEKNKKKFSENRASIRVGTISGYSKLSLKRGVTETEISGPNEDYRIRAPVLADRFGTEGQDSPSSFFVIYGSRVPAKIDTKDSEQENSKNGVYHLSPGADRGIVKNVKFKQMENRLRDDRILKSRQEGTTDLGVLKLPYNAVAEIYGTSPFYPGMVLYITPSLVGVGDLASRRSIARALGLGGYYIVHKTSTEISMGNLKSSVECNFESFPRADLDECLGEEDQSRIELLDLTNKPQSNNVLADIGTAGGTGVA